MPKILVQTDDGRTVQTLDFPIGSIYALQRMPGCPTHIGVHNLLNGLKRALQDASEVQQGGTRTERLSEQVMRRMAEQKEE